MINAKVINKTETKFLVESCTSGRPAIDATHLLGVAMTTKSAASFDQILSAQSFTYATSGGYWPTSKYVIYATVAVDVNGKESLPRIRVAGPTTTATDIIRMAIPYQAGAVKHDVYRGVSGASAGVCGTDLIYIGYVLQPTAAPTLFTDNGWQHTQYATPASFEDVVLKGSSRRVPSLRSSETRLAANMAMSFVTDGVVELPVDPAILHTLAEGLAVDWDNINFVVKASGGGTIALGKVTLAYPVLNVGYVNVKINC